jgi:hypothetical protein
MMVDVDRWSGEGPFTQRLLERLRGEPRVAYLRVEDAPASRAEADYNFISNELFVGFVATPLSLADRFRRWVRGGARHPPGPALTDLADLLARDDQIGTADYQDDGMLQFLRTQRIVPPYQTRGYKMVELVRLYPVGHAPRP